MIDSQSNSNQKNEDRPKTPIQSILPGFDAERNEECIKRIHGHATNFLKDWILHKQGTARELVHDLTAEFGPMIRMDIPDLIQQVREDPSLIKIIHEYIDSNLSLEAIEISIQGKRKRRGPEENTLDELFASVADFRKSDKFIEAVNFVSKLKEYAPYNNMMVFLQRPTAKYWASAKNWLDRFGRRIKEGAIPLIILRPMGPIMFVFEVDDTIGPDLPEHLIEPFSVEGDFEPEILDKLIYECGKDGIKVVGASLRGLLAGRVYKLWEDKDKEIKLYVELNKSHNPKEQFVTLCHEFAHVYLGHLGGDPDGKWPSRMGLSRNQRELEAETVTYVLCRRLDLITMSAEYLSGYLSKPVDRKKVSVDMIMKVAGRLEQKLPNR